VWIPLTDATPDNSCIYVLPLSRDPNYPSHPDVESVERLQDVRALPAPVGSALVWNQYLLHWGSRACARASEPRISWGIYFQSGDVENFNRSAREPAGPLGFEERLGYIGKALERYSTNFPLPLPLRAFTLVTRKYLPG
jgi:ectoine hydroxylase-related dioxygenase (phytanoyl-CoA dioxygenase family)